MARDLVHHSSMGKLVRIFFNSVFAVSLLLCSLTLLAWLSERSEMVWMGWGGHHTFEMGWHGGRIFVGDQTITYSGPSKAPVSSWTFHHAEAWRDDNDWTGAPGPFRWDFKPQQESWYVIQPRDVSAPCWMMVLLTGILPLTKLPRFIRWFSRDESTVSCPKCGYNVRSSHGRCPKCGQLPPEVTT